MAIGKTNISIDLVRRTIGSSKTDVGGLCTDDKVNMFSYYKPVDSDRITTDPNSDWPSLVKNSFGLIIPSLTVPIDTSLNWSRDKPKGGALSPYRLSDFGGYEHAAKPCISSGCTDKVSVNMMDSGYTSRTFTFEQIPADSKTNVSALNIGKIQDYYWGFAMLESLTSTDGPIRTCDKPIKEGGNSLTVDFFELGASSTHKYLLFLLSKNKSTGIAPDSWNLSEIAEIEPLVVYHNDTFINPVPLNIFWSLLYTASLVGITTEGATYNFYPVSNFQTTPLLINGSVWLKIHITNIAEHTITYTTLFDVEVISVFGTTERGGPLITTDASGNRVDQFHLTAGESMDLVLEIDLFTYKNGEPQIENLPSQTITSHVNVKFGEDTVVQTGNFKIRGM